MLSIKDYKYKSWQTFFEDTDQVELGSLPIRKSWHDLFKEEIDTAYWGKAEDYLTKHKGDKIYPYPELLFHAFNTTPLRRVKVVILGQDPYHGTFKDVPQAMGLSFSVPIGVPVPSSLSNMYNNMLKFGHIKDIPSHGNLTGWAKQGCLMLNTSLTVKDATPNSHSLIWEKFTDNVIRYISDNCDNVVFCLWGSNALNKLSLIDKNKHGVTVSSHPSGLSCNNGLRGYGSFATTDHFGFINNYLKQHNKKSIIWTKLEY